ncbi:hypothetical protein DP113_12255 [Brasilonema octagenarum UFV-E1]|uniref:Uncharacterized protein n=1 Tax=Brasilonema sennae CENA114 TaxID=415709 RepID=A0A856MFV8_9CYAN|nr:hypothetical protein [Brasilonema sennae]QDL08571.1 hypothetical protein DP114_12320 [Brasilonema sennae CENA114]QDL14927.1 hypothetical protein DP113_12255 [Brasilonema octagenarum UFV-E1]
MHSGHAARTVLAHATCTPLATTGGTRQPVATTVKARRLGCFPRQTLGEPQRQIPLSGNPLRSCHNAGNPRKALLSAGLAPQGAALRNAVAPQRA